jgi:hypothetical protein
VGAETHFKERSLATRASEARSSEAHARAEANFKKEERAKDGAKAMMEYQAEGKAIRDKMAKLKALRLAKEAADAAAAASAPVKPVAVKAAAVKAAAAKPAAAKPAVTKPAVTKAAKR